MKRKPLIQTIDHVNQHRANARNHIPRILCSFVFYHVSRGQSTNRVLPNNRLSDSILPIYHTGAWITLWSCPKTLQQSTILSPTVSDFLGMPTSRWRCVLRGTTGFCAISIFYFSMEVGNNRYSPPGPASRKDFSGVKKIIEKNPKT